MTYDLLIVGGGINGCAIAREAALLGCTVLLAEKDDLASHTSSASSKLIHGGLRYLETLDFRLVREALQERDRLMKAAPHLIRPLRFVLPHRHEIRPWWTVRAGLWIYDLLAGRTSLPRSRGLRRSDAPLLCEPLEGAPSGFVYWDARVDDARLTLANALDAAAQGAEIATRTGLLRAERRADGWHATLSDGRLVAARAIVNAAGAWVPDIAARCGTVLRGRLRLVKGSHIVVPRLYAGDHAYILQQPDRRVVFAIPYDAGTTMIGTTDVPVDRPEDAAIDAGEIAYLCAAANRSFRHKVAPESMVASWSGVRALYDDGAGEARAVTRDYVLELDAGGPPMLSVLGGKITTARALAEDAMERLAGTLGRDARPVTRTRAFPGGMTGDLDSFETQVARALPFLAPEQVARMVRAYGTLVLEMLEGAASPADLGQDFGAGFTEREARWMHDREWAGAPEDALERRSRLAMRLTAEERQGFERWWAATYG